MKSSIKRKMALAFDQARDLSSSVAKTDQCLVSTKDGFHIQDPIYLVQKVSNIQECILLCLRLNLCLSGNFVEFSAYAACTLHTSNPAALTSAGLPSSVFFDFSCNRKSHIITRFVDILPLPTSCGVALSTTARDGDFVIRRSRITGGFDTRFYSQPWYGLVIQKNRYVCGASLITRNPTDKATIWAVSAAHCFVDIKDGRKKVFPIKEFSFVFGIQDTRVVTPHITRRIAKKILWPSTYGAYDTVDEDIALIEFTQEIEFNMYVLPICLPYPKRSYDDAWLSSANCYLCGYGNTKDRFPFSPRKQISVPERLQCISSRAKRLFKGDSLLIESSTGINYKGVSQGDSGGGHMCQANDRSPAVLMGVINGRKTYQHNKYEYHRLVYSYNYYVAYVPFYVEWLYNKTGQIASSTSVSACSTCWK